MSEEIKVTVIQYPDRDNLVLAYIDPVSGRRKTKSAKTAVEKDAWKAAAAWEKELQEGTACPPSRITWADFRKRYEDEHLATLAPQTVHKARSVLDRIERHLNPDRLCKINASALSTFAAKLREPRIVKRGDKQVTLRPIKETSVAAIMRHVKAAVFVGRFAGDVGKGSKRRHA